jgi:hypothetical protein
LRISDNHLRWRAINNRGSLRPSLSGALEGRLRHVCGSGTAARLFFFFFFFICAPALLRCTKITTALAREWLSAYGNERSENNGGYRNEIISEIAVCQ